MGRPDRKRSLGQVNQSVCSYGQGGTQSGRVTVGVNPPRTRVEISRFEKPKKDHGVTSSGERTTLTRPMTLGATDTVQDRLDVTPRSTRFHSVPESLVLGGLHRVGW